MVKDSVNTREPSIKKRRKTSGATSETAKPDVDIYKVWGYK